MSGTVAISPAADYSAGPFSDAEKADLRRMTGYPTYGSGNAGFENWRFFQAYGLVEFRLNNLAPAEYQNARFLLSQCYPLEQAVWSASDTLNVEQAGPFRRNKNEMRERRQLFNATRRALCDALGIPPGPALGDGSVTLVV